MDPILHPQVQGRKNTGFHLPYVDSFYDILGSGNNKE